ncbi:hypothetical protein TWF225_007372 [Orbilia oligospora]|uniref:Uncharacterized protein n=1 Tax=Orbilia oligospora TaxID=2813651 RepID=A0A7C8P5L6_ORBOL|nr:hypothetical protein TWF751_010408 [Orbilia oligospora]KAF3180206.1 hypothetical protein TWF225_007372 [Orbilia oligospora]KAF3248991.1 hypothetical protein TWF217_008972 [Orbilia oligospora]KAF3262123.1 hypothetical protein TWF128_002796 [Orbilia oligospora]KAF3290669.1 hypothetical protein TWF132_006749 [Orbilia oligospora]
MEPNFVKVRGTDSMLLIVDSLIHQIDILQTVDGSETMTRDDSFDLKEAAKIPRSAMKVIIKCVEKENNRFERADSNVAYAVARLQLCDNGDILAIVRLVEASPERGRERRKAKY